MNARVIALDILSDVLKRESYLHLELKRSIPSEMKAEDRRFVTALVSATIENLYRIDYILDQFVRAKRVHRVIQNILRLGVCQLLFLDGVPARAAVFESVQLAEEKRKPQLKAFVNGVLRNIDRNKEKIRYPKAEDDFITYLHVMYSYPKWICQLFVDQLGEQQAEKLLGYTGDRSLTAIRQNKIKRQEGFDAFLPGQYLSDAYYIENAEDIENMELFKEGAFAVQGESSMLCVRAADIQATDHILDVCAAPGGKSCYAAQIASEGMVDALDIHPHRVELIEATAKRLGAENVRWGVQDATQYKAEYKEKYDVVLVDVPCTALGLLYRKPDIKIFKKKKDLAALQKIQGDILQVCADYIKPGGTLLYSTCTISKDENENQIKRFLKNRVDFTRKDLSALLPKVLARDVKEGTLQLLPHVHAVDGFFMAHMQKNE